MITFRIAFVLTMILGAIYAAAGLFDSLRHFGIGMAVCAFGALGHGLVGWMEQQR